MLLALITIWVGLIILRMVSGWLLPGPGQSSTSLAPCACFATQSALLWDRLGGITNAYSKSAHLSHPHESLLIVLEVLKHRDKVFVQQTSSR